MATSPTIVACDALQEVFKDAQYHNLKKQIQLKASGLLLGQIPTIYSLCQVEIPGFALLLIVPIIIMATSALQRRLSELSSRDYVTGLFLILALLPTFEAFTQGSNFSRLWGYNPPLALVPFGTYVVKDLRGGKLPAELIKVSSILFNSGAIGVSIWEKRGQLFFASLSGLILLIPNVKQAGEEAQLLVMNVFKRNFHENPTDLVNFACYTVYQRFQNTTSRNIIKFAKWLKDSEPSDDWKGVIKILLSFPHALPTLIFLILKEYWIALFFSFFAMIEILLHDSNQTFCDVLKERCDRWVVDLYLDHLPKLRTAANIIENGARVTQILGAIQFSVQVARPVLAITAAGAAAAPEVGPIALCMAAATVIQNQEDIIYTTRNVATAIKDFFMEKVVQRGALAVGGAAEMAFKVVYIGGEWVVYVPLRIGDGAINVFSLPFCKLFGRPIGNTHLQQPLLDVDLERAE